MVVFKASRYKPLMGAGLLLVASLVMAGCGSGTDSRSTVVKSDKLPIQCEYHGERDLIRIDDLLLEKKEMQHPKDKRYPDRQRLYTLMEVSGKARNLSRKTELNTIIQMRGTQVHGGRKLPLQGVKMLHLKPGEVKTFKASATLIEKNAQVDIEPLYVDATAGPEPGSEPEKTEWFGTILSPEYLGVRLPSGTVLREQDVPYEGPETLVLEVPLQPAELLAELDRQFSASWWRKTAEGEQPPQRVFEGSGPVEGKPGEFPVTIKVSVSSDAGAGGKTNCRVEFAAMEPTGEEALLGNDQSIVQRFGDFEPIAGVELNNLCLVKCPDSSGLLLKGIVRAKSANDITFNIILSRSSGATLWRQWDREEVDPGRLETVDPNILNVPLGSVTGDDFQIQVIQAIEWPGPGNSDLYIPYEIPGIQTQAGPPVIVCQKVLSTETGPDGTTRQVLELPGSAQFVLDSYDKRLFQLGWLRGDSSLSPDSRRYSKGSLGLVVKVLGEGETPGYSRCELCMGPGVR